MLSINDLKELLRSNMMPTMYGLYAKLRLGSVSYSYLFLGKDRRVKDQRNLYRTETVRLKILTCQFLSWNI